MSAGDAAPKDRSDPCSEPLAGPPAHRGAPALCETVAIAWAEPRAGRAGVTARVDCAGPAAGGAGPSGHSQKGRAR